MIQVDENSQYRQNINKNIESCQLKDLWFSLGTAQYNSLYMYNISIIVTF